MRVNFFIVSEARNAQVTRVEKPQILTIMFSMTKKHCVSNSYLVRQSFSG